MIGQMMKQNRWMQKIVMFMILACMIDDSQASGIIPTTSRRIASSLNNSAGSFTARSLPLLQDLNDQGVGSSPVYQSRPVYVSGYPMVPSQAMMPQNIQRRSFSSDVASLDAVPNDEQRYTFLEQNFKKELDSSLNVLQVSRALGGFSYQQIADVMSQAQELAKQNNVQKMSMKNFYDTLADIAFSAKISKRIELADKNGVMIVAPEKRVAIHEAAHTVVELYFSSGYVIPLVSAESRKNNAGVTARIVAYAHNPYIKQHLINSIMMALAGITAEQVFALGYSPKMLTNTTEIFDFIQHPTAAGDVQAINELLRQLKAEEKPTTQEIQDLIVRCYQAVYKFITEHKQEIQELGDKLEAHGTLYEQDIYTNKPKPLFDFEQGPLPQEHALQYINRRQAFTYGFDNNGNYVGESGVRDQFGNLEELD
jgi:hypothetical protein